MPNELRERAANHPGTDWWGRVSRPHERLITSPEMPRGGPGQRGCLMLPHADLGGAMPNELRVGLSKPK